MYVIWGTWGHLKFKFVNKLQTLMITNPLHIMLWYPLRWTKVFSSTGGAGYKLHQVKSNLTIRENLILQLIQEFWVEEKGHLINMTALAAKASVTIWTVGNSVFISNFVVDRKTHVGLVHVCMVCTLDYKSRRESRIFQEWNVNSYLTIISK